eukprot:GAHX01000648.1.p1 GENE.GAHX01000648.1~~GAHX01000648.1.p1  ORF type:complete len:116 (-),score=15.22 GAHX01000648.1:32-379(-)
MSNLIEVIEISDDMYMCLCCGFYLAPARDNIISTQFVSKSGPAHLVGVVCNIKVGKAEEKELTSGSHEIAKIYCIKCEQKVGWKYIKASNSSQQYKVGKFCIEVKKIRKKSVVNN